MINVGQSLFLLVFRIQKPESQQAQIEGETVWQVASRAESCGGTDNNSRVATTIQLFARNNDKGMRTGFVKVGRIDLS